LKPAKVDSPGREKLPFGAQLTQLYTQFNFIVNLGSRDLPLVENFKPYAPKAQGPILAEFENQKVTPDERNMPIL
jgi:hypothetical protein